MRVLTKEANREAVETMERHGLTVVETPHEAIAAWENVIQAGLMEYVGGKFDVKYYDQAKRVLEEFRREYGR